MKISYSWLKDYLNTNKTPQEIADKLTQIGLEVDDIKDTKKELENFIIAKVIKAEKHPNADRLKVLKVDTGQETLQVVCGAPNAREGLIGILARPGDIIPNGNFKLKKSKIRNVESQGMMCSYSELNLGKNSEGIIELSKNLNVKPGDKAEKALALDIIIDAELTPNRADYLAVRGIARDLSAANMGKFKEKEIKPIKGTYKNPINIKIEDKKLCPMFAGRYIKGVKNCPSPKWLSDKLQSIGLKTISALVDITNYITWDISRPMHVFDADKLSQTLTIRSAKDKEKIKALDEETYNLQKGDIVITDDNKLQSLAGIIGGIESATQMETTNIYLESALFDSIQIRKTARRLGIESDAKYRFERYVDPKTTLEGIEYATQLILEICGGEPSEILIAGNEPKTEHAITFRPERFEKKIGLKLTEKEMQTILENLHFKIKTGSTWQIIPHSSRLNDIICEDDIIEEIIRIYGYDAIPLNTVKTTSQFKAILTEKQKTETQVRRMLAGRGLYETTTYSFTNSKIANKLTNYKKIELANPISSELDIMRRSILPNHLIAISENYKKGIQNTSLFELGPVFYGDKPGQQQNNLSIVRSGKKWQNSWEYKEKTISIYDVKADLNAVLEVYGITPDKITYDETNTIKGAHPYKSAAIIYRNEAIGYIGEIHPNILKTLDMTDPIVFMELTSDKLNKKEKMKTQKRTLELSNLHPIYRDFAFIINKETKAGDIKKVILSANKLIEKVEIFDLYIDPKGNRLDKNKKSLAFRITLQPTSETLKDEHIKEISDKIITKVTENFNATLRDK